MLEYITITKSIIPEIIKGTSKKLSLLTVILWNEGVLGKAKLWDNRIETRKKEIWVMSVRSKDCSGPSLWLNGMVVKEHSLIKLTFTLKEYLQSFGEKTAF